MKKPSLLPALIVTLIYIAACAGLYALRGNTLTVYTFWSADRQEVTYELGDDAPIEILGERIRNDLIEIDVRALHPSDGYDFSVTDASDSDYGYSFYLRIDKDLHITDFSTANFNGFQKLYPMTLIWIAACTVIFFYTYFKQKRYSIFSYNTIYYLGFGIMGAVTTAVFFEQTMLSYSSPQYASVLNLFHSIYSSARVYAMISFPVLSILTIALIVSNIILWRKEGIGFTNMVATIFGIFLTVTNLLVIIAPDFTDANADIARIQYSVINGISALYLYFESMWIGAMLSGIVAARAKADCDRDYLIILGCGMRADGTPTPLLKGRCDQALHFWHRQLDTTGKKAKFITSGGQGSDEIISESECMKNYLMTQGVSESDIIMENKSTTTMENFRFSLNLMPDKEALAAFFTTKYHVFRSGIWARRAGFARTGIQSEGASTKWYFWPNAFVREFIGLMTQHWLKQGLVMAGLVLFYGLTTYFFF